MCLCSSFIVLFRKKYYKKLEIATGRNRSFSCFLNAFLLTYFFGAMSRSQFHWLGCQSLVNRKTQILSNVLKTLVPHIKKPTENTKMSKTSVGFGFLQ